MIYSDVVMLNPDCKHIPGTIRKSITNRVGWTNLIAKRSFVNLKYFSIQFYFHDI